MAGPVLVRSFDLVPPRGWRKRSLRQAEERVIAIGDIHGRWDLLQTLIAGIEAFVVARTPEPTRIVVLGDFIDRGANSRAVIDFLRTIQDRTGRVTVLLGNHEASLLASVAGDGDAQRLWLAHGGDATLASYNIEPPFSEDVYAFGALIARGIGADVIDWLRDLPLTYRSGDFFFCHAGIRPGRRLDRQTNEDLLWIRDDFIADDRDHKAVIVHGHTIMDTVDVRHNRISVDTGAHASGVLSAVVIGETGNWVISTEPAQGIDEAFLDVGERSGMMQS